MAQHPSHRGNDGRSSNSATTMTLKKESNCRLTNSTRKLFRNRRQTGEVVGERAGLPVSNYLKNVGYNFRCVLEICVLGVCVWAGVSIYVYMYIWYRM